VRSFGTEAHRDGARGVEARLEGQPAEETPRIDRSPCVR
jgi:hypothetical protein